VDARRGDSELLAQRSRDVRGLRDHERRATTGMLGEQAQRAQARLAGEAVIDEPAYEAVLFEGDGDALLALNRRVAARPGPLVSVQGLSSHALAAGEQYVIERLLAERSVSINTAAAGGNASLMTIG